MGELVEYEATLTSSKDFAIDDVIEKIGQRRAISKDSCIFFISADT